MSPWLWTESRANVRWITLDSLLPTLTPGINGRQFGVHALDHHRPRLTRSRIQPRSNFRDGQAPLYRAAAQQYRKLKTLLNRLDKFSKTILRDKAKLAESKRRD